MAETSASTNTDRDADSERADGTTRCPLCAHAFEPGVLKGSMYCPRCGRRFNPNATMEDTVAILHTSVGNAGDDLGEEAGEAQAESAPPVPGQDTEERFGEYDIISEVARGGMGVVYKARQRTLKRIVALKVLRGGDGAREEDLERFMREAKAAASLSHPNIVPIYELSVYRGLHFFTMEYIDGPPLDRMIEAGGLTPYRACELVEIIARAIQYAHEHGIIHRDLKPANIIIDPEGRPMLTDFGLAVNLASDVRSQRMTRTGAVMGTIPYIPPEQAGGRVDAIGPRSDVYSLGAVLYEMLTGHPPFQGETQFELLRRVIHQEPVRPRVANPKIHQDLETICVKCLEKDPRRRYASARELAEDCRAFLHGEMIKARPVGFAYRLYRKALRHRAIISLGTCTLLLIAVAIRQYHSITREKRAKRQVERRLDSEQMQKQLAELEAAEYKKELVRAWRMEYRLRFDRPFPASKSRPVPGLPWLDTRHVKLRFRQGFMEMRGHGPQDRKLRGCFGLAVNLPRDFRLSCMVRLPAADPGNLFLLLNADPGFRTAPATQVIRLGAPGNPGAQLRKDDITLTENPDFQLAACSAREARSGHGWQRVELVRELVRGEHVLRVFVHPPGDSGQGMTSDDDERNSDVIPIIEDKQPDLAKGAVRTRLALAAAGGTVQVKAIVISVRGMSPAMIKTHLELAGSLDLRRDHRLAMTLYQRVAAENTSREAHVKALRGMARCLAASHRMRPPPFGYLKKECDFRCRAFSRTRDLEPAEADYFLALAMAAFPNNQAQRGAIHILDRAYERRRDKQRAPGPYNLLSRLESVFVLLRLGNLPEATRRLRDMQQQGELARLNDEYAAEVHASGALAVLLETVDRIFKQRVAERIPYALQILRAMAILVPDAGKEIAIRYQRYARELLEKRDYERAGKLLDQAIVMAPAWYLPHFDRARLYFRQGRIRQGQQAMEAAVQAAPESLDLQILIAGFYLDNANPRLNDPALAEKAARRAVEVSQEKHPVAWEMLGRALLLQDRLGDARDAIATAIKLEDTPRREQLIAKIQAMIDKETNARSPRGEPTREDEP